MRILAADVGGTKTAVGIFEIGASALRVVREGRFPSAEFPSLERVLAAFLAGAGRRPRFAGIGVAGPVRGGRARVTKLPWILEERRLEREFPGTAFRLVNDFVAVALGLPYLKPRQFRTLAPGRPEAGGPMAVLGAGTGLGEAGLLPFAGRYLPFPSEGGHADFGPRDDRESRFAAFLRERFGRAEWDRILSGEGLVHIYDFLRAENPGAETAATRRLLEADEDRAAAISRAALSGADGLCRETLDLFVSLYGSEAGNVALRYRATGGLYVAGGIAPKILPALESGAFVEAFRRKPPLEDLLARIPVRVVLEPRLGLFGAAAAGYRTAIEATRASSKRIVRFTAR